MTGGNLTLKRDCFTEVFFVGGNKIAIRDLSLMYSGPKIASELFNRPNISKKFQKIFSKNWVAYWQNECLECSVDYCLIAVFTI